MNTKSPQRHRPSGAPAFQLYAADFVDGCTFLSAAAVGCYARMLCHSWDKGPIPNNDAALYKAMGLSPADPPFGALWLEVSPKWILTDDGWINARLESVREEQAALSAKGRKGGRASAKSRRALAREQKWNAQRNQTPTTRATSEATAGDTNTATQAQPESKPPISDLRSPISDLQPPDSERARADELAPVSVLPNQPASLVNGGELRKHGSHAWCSWPDRDGLCVHVSLHSEFVGKLGRQAAAADLLRWYPTVVARFVGVSVGEDGFRFWRNEFAAWVGTVTAPPAAAVHGKGDASRESMQRVIARREEQRQRGERS